MSVLDSATNLSSDLGALNSNDRVNSIVVGSGGALTLDATEVATDTAALGEITGGYTIAVSDTAANVATNLDALQSNGNVASIALTDGGAPTLTVGQGSFLSDYSMIGLVAGSFVVDVTGVATNQVGAVEAAYNGLSNAGNGTLSIEVSDTAAHLTDAALTNLGSDADVPNDRRFRGARWR